MNVQVWDYEAQQFIESFSYEDEKRVRVDYFGDLNDLAVFEVFYCEAGSFYVEDGNKPLTDWVIELS